MNIHISLVCKHVSVGLKHHWTCAVSCAITTVAVLFPVYDYWGYHHVPFAPASYCDEQYMSSILEDDLKHSICK